MIALLVMTDGRRECISQSLPQALEQLDGEISVKLIHDDSGDGNYRNWLREQFPTFTVIGGRARKGFGGAIQTAWKHLEMRKGVRFVFHLEDDFLLTRPVDLDGMARTLYHHPHLTQLALLRQAVNAEERAAGGVIECDPDAFDIVECRGHTWIEHRRFWTTNPSLYPRGLVKRGWPSGRESEGRFAIELYDSGPELRSAYWGEGVSCEHIGETRIGVGY